MKQGKVVALYPSEEWEEYVEEKDHPFTLFCWLLAFFAVSVGVSFLVVH